MRITLSSARMTVFAGYVTVVMGCATVVEHPQSAVLADDSCPVYYFDTPAGLQLQPDQPLPERALGKPSKGGVCSGKVYKVTGTVNVYRVWTAAKPNTLYGGWWSFNKPEGTRQDYRQNYNICPSWSALDQMSSCTIKPGTEIVVGPGQSAYCPTIDQTLPASAGLQVYIPNYFDGGQIYVENCTPGVAWP